jgi:hypothetical protein
MMEKYDDAYFKLSMALKITKPYLDPPNFQYFI